MDTEREDFVETDAADEAAETNSQARPHRSVDEILKEIDGELDDSSVEALRKLSERDASRILNELLDAWDLVRNRSAYVSTAAKSLLSRNLAGGGKDRSGGKGFDDRDHGSRGGVSNDWYRDRGGHDDDRSSYDRRGSAHSGNKGGAPPPPPPPGAGDYRQGPPARGGGIYGSGNYHGPPPHNGRDDWYARGGDDGWNGRCSGGKGYGPDGPHGHAGSAYGGGMSRGEMEQELEDLIKRYNLDASADDALHRVPIQEAREVLRAVDGGVRNPSAFVVSKLRLLETGASVNGTAGPRGGGAGYGGGDRHRPRADVFSYCESMLRYYHADERARNIAAEIPPEVLSRIFSQLERIEVRNPSAFIFQACANYQKTGSMEGPAPFHPATSSRDVGAASADRHELEARIARCDLDGTATTMLRELRLDDALSVMAQINETVKNPSAFVTTAARRLLGSGGPPARERERFGELPPNLSRRDIERELEEFAASMNLDDRAREVLHEVPLERAWSVVAELRKTWNVVRNPSAYVFNSCVKGSTSRGGGDYPDAPWAPAPSAPKLSAEALKAERMAKDLGVDDSSLGHLQTVPIDYAMDLLRSLADKRSSVRNPSAFIVSAVKEYRERGRGGAGPAPRVDVPPGSAAEELEGLMSHYCLDKTATEALRSFPVDEALGIMNACDSGVRNPSAWAMNMVKKHAVKQGDDRRGTSPEAKRRREEF
eukprot:TRINITY_DN15529_c0_g1_i1.p1 TRINITY_DN15529_c0_g1~~TRINITY_DN15529_c0_g1_i1.p1  ORF type:complete len:757 (+),score=178.04 TRINITY_DN15529_c0_g1_i1:133-2271(+)